MPKIRKNRIFQIKHSLCIKLRTFRGWILNKNVMLFRTIFKYILDKIKKLDSQYVTQVKFSPVPLLKL